MWARLDDDVLDHPKLVIAGDLIGKNGQILALGFFAYALVWSNKHLTDGFLPEAVVKGLDHLDKPRSIADALVKAELLERVDGGFQIHDFKEYNRSAAKVKAKRKADRLRQQEKRDHVG